jgi:hypothetical protein
MWGNLTKRYLELLCSIYVYNEHRGYSGLDRILAAVREKFPDDPAFIARIENHRADEYKHYVMFKRWFEQRGVMPYLVGKFGNIDGIIEMFFGCDIESLDPNAVLSSPGGFAKLCRAIALTERRGMKMVQQLLSSPLVKTDEHLIKIFKVVERDEPSHWEPYEDWIRTHGGPETKLRERFADAFTQWLIILVKFPLLFANLSLPRCTQWPEENAAVTAEARWSNPQTPSQA